MIAKCNNCNFVRIKRQRKSCPHCGSKLCRPTLKELESHADSMMDRMRGVVALGRSLNATPEQNLAGFMAVLHGRHLTPSQAKRMLS